MEKEIIQQQELLEFHPKMSFTFICKGRVVSIGFDEITHVSKYGYEVVIYTDDRQYRARHTLQEILNDLPVNDFFRIHRSHIISLRCMNGVKQKRLRVGEYYLPVSKFYKLQLCNRLTMLLERNYDFFCEKV